MQYNYKYRLDPPEALTETLLYHVDTCRQLYNHVLYKLNESDDIPARYSGESCPYCEAGAFRPTWGRQSFSRCFTAFGNGNNI